MDLSEATRGALGEARGLETRQPVVVFSPHPLQAARDRQLEYAHFLPNETIAAYLERTGILARMGRQPFVLTIDGVRVPASLWARCRPKTGTLINLYAVVRGGGGAKKNPLGVIAMIALMVTVPGAQGLGAKLAGSAFGTALGLSVNVASVGLMVLGGLAINTVFPPPKPTMPNQPGSRAASPTYSLQGGSNRMRPYDPFPKIVGAHIIFPDFGARPYSEFEGEDQWGYYVFDYGYNDVELSGHKVGANPLSAFEHVIEESGPDGKLTLFPGNVDTVAGAELLLGAAYLVRTSSPNTTALAVDVVGLMFVIGNDGSLHPYSGIIQIEYRAVGAAAWLPFWNGATDIFIGNGTRKPLRNTYRIQVPAGQYEVRVRFDHTNMDPNIPFDNFTHDLTWSQLRSYQPDTADYAGRKRIALKVKASQLASGTLQQFNSLAKARCEVWNGAAWVTAHTSNPAWWYLDAVRGKTVNGLRVWGGGQADAKTDLENIKAFGAWCTAQGLKVDGIFDQQLSVWDTLSALALNGRATPSWGTGKLGVVWDAPDLPVTAYFGMHNIVAGSFEINYATEHLADAVEVWYTNPEREWQRDFVRAPVPGAASQVRVKRIELPLCTSKQLASEAANLYAAQNVYRARRYTWRMDWEGMPCSRGEVGALSHDLASLDYSGRFIEGGSSAALKLPRTVPLYPGGSFIVIVRPNGALASYNVQGGNGDTDTLVPTDPSGVPTPLPFNPWGDADHPPYDYRWHYGPTATPGRKVKIEAFKPVSERLVQLSAIDEVPEFYAAKANPVLTVPARPVFGAVQLSKLELSEDGVRAGTGYLVRVIAVWDVAGDYAYANVRVSIGGGPLAPFAQELRARSFDFTVPDLSQVTVEVTVFSSMGHLGNSATLTASRAVNFAAVAPPSNVTSFALDGNTFRWQAVGDVDVVGYRIRFQYGENRSIADANFLHQGLLSSSPATFQTLPAGRCTFMLTAVDAAGLESVVAAVVIKDLGDVQTENVVESLDFKAASWPGILTGGVEVGGDLEAADTTDFYGPDGAPLYGADADPFYEDSLYETMIYETDAFYFSNDWLGSVMSLQHTIEGAAVKIEFRTGNQESFFGGDADPLYGPDAELFYGEAGAWLPWPGAVTFEGGDYQLRVTTGGSPVQGAVRGLTVLIDVPDITEDFIDVAIAPAGTRLPITRDFDAIKNVQITLQDDGGGAVSVRILDRDPDLGPLVQCIDAAQLGVAGTVNAHIRGR